MQQGLQTMAGGVPLGALPARPADFAPVRHRALMLIRDRPVRHRHARVWHRALSRLLLPAAQVEGVDHHLTDPALPAAAGMAGAFVLVLPPLGNLSTPLYSVHPRRNDRFLVARPALKSLYPEVDFASFAFTGHALTTLAATCPDRFLQLRKVLAAAWIERMQRLLALLPRDGALIDLPAPAWLPRPPIPGEGRRRIKVDPDNRVEAVEAIIRMMERR